MRLMVESLGEGLLGTHGEIDWLRPVFPGTTLKAVTQVVEIVPHPKYTDRATVICESVVYDQNDVPMLKWRATLGATKKPQ